MKRLPLALVLLLLTAGAAVAAPEKWWESYDRGVAAVNAKNYRAAADALSQAIAQMPSENSALRAKDEIITYVPHFWLGIARYNLGDVDAALREWRLSEEQGAIARTDNYARLREWVTRAQGDVKRRADSKADSPKKLADAAISRAVASQADALAAGGDRSDSYRSAQRKLQDALLQFHKAGSDAGAYAAAETNARESAALFADAANDGRREKAQRVAAAANRLPAPQQNPANPAPQPVPVGVAAVQPPVVAIETAAPLSPVQSEAEVTARVAVQQYRRKVLDGAATAPSAQLRELYRGEIPQVDALRRRVDAAGGDAEYQQISRMVAQREAVTSKRAATLLAPALPQPAPAAAATIAVPAAGSPAADPPAAALREAWRAFAAGELETAESLLTRIVTSSPTAEAYLLRGCTRYTRGMLSRTPAPLLATATEDFRAALSRNASLRLDATFSPRLVAFFEQVKKSR